MDGGIGRFVGNRISDHFPIFLAGNRVGPRHCVSCVVVAGRCGTVEGRNRLSAMVRVGEQRIWGAAIHFLSATLMAAGGGAGICRAVERGAGNLHRAGANAGGSLHVRARAQIFSSGSSPVRGGLLYRQSVCAAGRLPAQRLRGGTGVGFFAGVSACRAATERLDGKPLGLGTSVGSNFWAIFRRHLACECAGRRFGQLQHGASLCVGGDIRKVFPALIARSRRSGPGIWVGLLLSRAGSLRTKMGEHWRGAFLRVAACGELSVHQDCGSGA